MKKIRENTPPAGKDLEKAPYSAPTIVTLGPADEITGGRKNGSKTDSSGYGTYYLNS